MILNKDTMAKNKKIEILQKGSPEWLKRFSAGKSKNLTKNRLKLNSLRDNRVPQTQSKAHKIQSANARKTEALVKEKTLGFNSLHVLATPAPHSEPDIPEIPIDSPPEEVPDIPPQELPQKDPEELPQQEPQELPSQVPGREEIPQPLDLRFS